VHYFFNLKNTTKDPVLRTIAKYFLNTLYGKLGQVRDFESLETLADQKEYSTHEYLTERFGLVMVPHEARHNKFILPYLAAYITDLARLRHWQLMQRSPKSVFYCDTDSIITNDPKAFRAVTGSRIGQLQNEGTWKEGVFVAPKCYALRSGNKQKVRFKGFQTEDFSFRDLEQALRKGRLLSSTRLRILSFAESTRRKHDIVRKEGTFLKTVNMTKTVSAQYDKRKMIDDSRFVFDTEPFSFEELQ